MLKLVPPLQDDRGFTLVELMIAIGILTVAILGIAASAGRLSTVAGETELRALAIEALEDRINFVRLDPVYDSLPARYAGIETSVVGLPGANRVTSVVRTTQNQGGPAGKTLDYTTISVTVSGGNLRKSMTREVVVAAP